MENVKISDREAVGQIRAILERMNPGSPFAEAIRRVFAESSVEAEAEAADAPSVVGDAALRSVRLPEATVRQWESEQRESESHIGA